MLTSIITFLKSHVATLIRYGLVGIVIYAIEYLVYLTLIFGLAVIPVYSNMAAKVVAGLIGYFLHRKFTFQKQSSHDVHSDLLKYVICLAINIPVAGIVFYSVSLLGYGLNVTKIIADVICILIAYLQSRYLVFKPAVNN